MPEGLARRLRDGEHETDYKETEAHIMQIVKQKMQTVVAFLDDRY